MKELESLGKDDFDPHVGERFQLELSEQEALALELVSTHPLSSDTVAESQRAPFSLVFRSPGEKRHAPQQIYTVRHPEMGPIEIFLVPIGPDDQGMRYEAVFT